MTITSIPLAGRSGFYSRHSSISSPSQWQEEMKEFVQAFMRGERLYVENIGDPRRKGSIGYVRDILNLENILKGHSTYLYGYTRDPRPVSEFSPEEVNAGRISYVQVEIGWDGRSNKTRPSNYDLEWLKGYDGPTVWVYGEPKVEQVTPEDRLGRPIKVGDFICYILHHFCGSGASTQFGKVTKITKNGNVFAKNIKLGEDERSEEKKINDNSTIVIMTDDLMSQLTLARLSIL